MKMDWLDALKDGFKFEITKWFLAAKHLLLFLPRLGVCMFYSVLGLWDDFEEEWDQLGR